MFHNRKKQYAARTRFNIIARLMNDLDLVSGDNLSTVAIDWIHLIGSVLVLAKVARLAPLAAVMALWIKQPINLPL